MSKETIALTKWYLAHICRSNGTYLSVLLASLSGEVRASYSLTMSCLIPFASFIWFASILINPLLAIIGRCHRLLHAYSIQPDTLVHSLFPFSTKGSIARIFIRKVAGFLVILADFFLCIVVAKLRLANFICLSRVLCFCCLTQIYLITGS